MFHYRESYSENFFLRHVWPRPTTVFRVCHPLGCHPPGADDTLEVGLAGLVPRLALKFAAGRVNVVGLVRTSPFETSGAAS